MTKNNPLSTQAKILFCIREQNRDYKTPTSKEVIELTGLSNKAVMDELARLEDAGEIYQAGQGKWAALDVHSDSPPGEYVVVVPKYGKGDVVEHVLTRDALLVIGVLQDVNRWEAPQYECRTPDYKMVILREDELVDTGQKTLGDEE